MIKHFKKGLLVLVISAGICANGHAQDRGEFADQPNGLMYSDSNMKALSHMVDSLNLRFKVCDISRTLYSNPQGKLWSLEFSSQENNFKELRKELSNHISLESLLDKHKKELKRVDTNLLIIEIATHREDNEVKYLSGDPSTGYKQTQPLNELKNKLSPGKWVYRFEKKDEYSKENYLYAYQVPQPLTQQPIPVEYARYIQYVDCMVDTNSVVMLAKNQLPDRYVKKNEEVSALTQYLNSRMGLKRKKGEYDYPYLTEEKVKYAESSLKKNAWFLELLNEAVDSCIENDCSSNGLEELAAFFISKNKALELKRHHLVVGRCSMDPSPRLHARDIAILAAETNSWDIFLRAHLDIMNDRFERMSDGSYAYGGRKTYLKELEELNLDVVDLILGLSLRAQDLPDHHYLGTVWRLGWAMTESKDQTVFEEKVIKMLKDKRLDEFNRGLLFVLLHSYYNELEDIHLANEKMRQMKQQVADFPASLHPAILEMKERGKGKL